MKGLDIALDIYTNKMETLFMPEQAIAKWRDPLTPPQTKLDCINSKRVFGRKVCVEFALRKKWMECELILKWNLTEDKVETAINEALRDAAIASIISAIVAAYASGGAAAAASAQATFISTLKARLISQFPSIVLDMDQSCGWSPDWD